MRGTIRLTPLLAMLILALPSPSRAQWNHDPHQPLYFTSAPGDQRADAALADGAGGAYVFWEDSRAGNKDVYAQHVLSTGAPDPTWTSNGLPLCTATGDQIAIKAVLDNSGGIFVAWNDNRTGVTQNYLTRITTAGALAAGFPANGLLLDGIRANAQGPPQLILDSGGNATVVWQYAFSGTDQDIYGARVLVNGTLQWSSGLAVSGISQTNPAICAESGAFDVAYLESGTNVVIGRWGGGGTIIGSTAALSAAGATNTAIRMVTDGAQGTMVAWIGSSGGQFAPNLARFAGGIVWSNFGNIAPYVSATTMLGDFIYAGNYQDWLTWSVGFTAQTVNMQAITRFGFSSPVAVASKASFANLPGVLAGDGAGDAVVAFNDNYNDGQAHAMRVLSNGTIPPLWSTSAPDGPLVTQTFTSTQPSAITDDGNGGALVFSYDTNLVPARIELEHIDRWGALNGEPSAISVKDIPNDQGGQVRVAWNASYLDVPVTGSVGSYWIWRQVPTAAAEARLAHGEALLREGETPAPGALRLEHTAGSPFAWEFVASQVANGFAHYSVVTPTASDSVGGHPDNTVFMVEARHVSAAIGWPSLPDSGHSVDNIPPAEPAPFAAFFAAGNTHLHWGENHESDLAGYLLYRGSSAGFVPGPGNLVASLTDTLYADPFEAQYYKLAAIDVHGNVSPFASLGPGNTLATPGDAPPRDLAFALASPNPARESATLRYALPNAASVRIGVYDLHGRLIRELVNTASAAGTFTARWDGRDAANEPAGNGVFFARFEAGGATRIARIVLVR